MVNTWKTMYTKFDEFTNHKYKNIVIDGNRIFKL